MILTDLRHKIKALPALLDRKDVYIALIIAFVAIASYILGALSQIDSSNAPVTVTQATASVASSQKAVSTTQNTFVQTKSASTATSGIYVGSKSGNKYHLPSCSGAQRIAEANKVWFATKAEAENAGYTPAANCKGI